MKYFFSFILLSFIFSFFISCKKDSLAEAVDESYVTATIDSVNWEASHSYSEKETGENGPLTIVGEGEELELELALTGIKEPGVYPLGINRTAKIRIGNNVYSTLDIQDAGEVIISRYDNNRIEGEFNFKAQWLSAGNQLVVKDGKFSVFYY